VTLAPAFLVVIERAMPKETDEKHTETEATATEAVVETIDSKIARLEDEKRELHDRFLRLAAEFENWKKRSKKEHDEAQVRGRDALLRELLPSLDNLERALQHAGEGPLAVGVRLVEKQLLQALEKFGVTRFSAVGKPFDPNLHDAIQQVETAEMPPGSVAQEFASGYMGNGRLLRPAMVAVAKGPASASGEAAPPSDRETR
jgi:molecular chaperone GrpE